MIVTAIHHGLDLTASSGSQRTAGVHLSDLYGSLYAKLEPKRYAKKSDEPPPIERWGIGMAFEDMLEVGLKQRVQSANGEVIERPGELQTEHTSDCPRERKRRTWGCGCWCGGGVIHSPDLFIYADTGPELRVGEIKLNSMSAKDIPWRLGETYTGFHAKFNKYTTQIKNHCFHSKTRFGRLYAFSVREMVFFNEPKIFRAWDIEFTMAELKEEWGWVRQHGRDEGILTR